ncbi:AAA family ATPase [Microbacterium ulmi]|uniref:ATP-binding protein n=1 Tax=Microbacterium ulmi TaxID=179095 RepID=A0A7Y2M2Y3_9MICO|nr:ATP-binding protein [Microbacterium ulmi]NII69515.1 hypothetical protein [Microbacterium ulmi]NNH05059.1 ATP-binding protein [Microbacterium ulmi]
MTHFDSAPVALVGRAAELETISTFLDGAAVDGSPLVVTGDPGVGKTALLSAAEMLALDGGFRVVSGAGIEYESDVSFAGLHQIVDPIAEELRNLPRASRIAIEVAVGRGPGPPPERLTLLNATLALLRQAASASPLLIVIDDLHWLDRASGAVVGFIGRRLRGSRIGMLGATRAGLSSFFERAGMPQMDVRPLSEEAALDLLKRTFVHLSSRVARQIVDDAQGNPLALLEFAAAASRPPTSRRQPAVTSGTSREVRALYLERIEDSRYRPGVCCCLRRWRDRETFGCSLRQLRPRASTISDPRRRTTSSHWTTGPPHSSSGIP